MFHIKNNFLLLLFLLASVKINAQVKYFNIPEHVADSDYIANTIIFKIKPEYREFCKENIVDIPKLNNVLSAIGASGVIKKFPGKTPPSSKFNRYGEKMEDISMIYELKFYSGLSLVKAINLLLSTEILEYAEPHYLPHLFTAFNPNDPLADTTSPQFSFWHLKTVKAYEAWGIQKGDTNIVIGITDTGTDLLNPDLYNNIKKNYADPIDGVDNDGDGFTDNFYGWDLGNNDYSPQWENVDHGGHGVFVSGLSSSYTNNEIGGAGTGFKCMYLPVKINDASGALTMAYEGIVYAADHGCDIINCSWGGYGGAGQFGQSIINYATNNMNAVVIAACGNSNNDYPVYPASYDNVLSVAATDINDYKWTDITNGTGSSFGTTVDISAPGGDVYSTWIDGSYSSSSGTSFAAPIVCGAAGIVKAHFPSYSAIQIAAQLKSSTDNIYTIPYNIQYNGMLGSGRLNMFKSLTASSPWIVLVADSITDHNDMMFLEGDTLFISGLYKNYLAPTNNLKATLSTTCPYVAIIDSITFLGAISTLGTKDNDLDPFMIKILHGIPVSTQIDFKLTFEDPFSNYISHQYFSIIVNVDYLDIETNLVTTTMTSKGKIGYNQQSSLTQGVGFTYNSSASYLSCGGFLVGNSYDKVSDDIYGLIVGTFDNDFKTTKIVNKITPSVRSDFDAECIFNDDLAGANKLNLSITNKVYAWDTFPRNKFIIFEYTIKNNGSTLSTLYAGLFMDFDMSSDGGFKDRIGFDAANKMGYTFSTQGGPYAAIKLLSNGIVRHYAFDKDGAFNGSSTSININNGFSSYNKYSVLKTNSNRNTAGVADLDGNNVADMISTGPFILQHGDSVVVAFALIAGDHLADIQGSAEAADEIYNHAGISENSLENAIQLSDVFPNPSNGSITVNIHLPSSSEVELGLYDRTGRKLQAIAKGKLSQGHHQYSIQTQNFAAGLYLLRLTCGKTVISKDVTIIK